jgi:periodic tryptophan protein 1
MIDEDYAAAHDFVTCVSWVRRGVPKLNPTEVQYDREELRQMVTRTKRQLVDTGDDATRQEIAAQADQMEMDLDAAPAVPEPVDPEDDEIERLYGLDTYDDESDEEASNVIGGFGNLVHHADNQEDPYLQPNPEDSESELEDFLIQPNDNLLLVGHVQEDASSLDVYVYNDEDNYVHHDVILPAFPMCFESIEYDCEQKCSANLMAIGDMTKYIHIWDLDVVNELEPKITLKGHKDAVLGLSWNRNVTNVLASCSVDMTVRLWDLNVNKSIHKLSKFTERIQSVEFHPSQGGERFIIDFV